ncbi:MAG: hypothetical protein AB7Y74_00395, partial [Syntrophorhabdus sp.]
LCKICPTWARKPLGQFQIRQYWRVSIKGLNEENGKTITFLYWMEILQGLTTEFEANDSSLS